MASHFKRSYIDENNYEVEASPMAAESITKLHAGEGARKFAANPKKKREAAKPARGILIGVAIAALVVIIGGFLLMRAILGNPGPNEGGAATDAFSEEPQQVEVAIDPSTGAVESGGISYMDETYSMVAVEGTAAVVETDPDGGQRSLFVLSGTPVTMFLYDGTLLVPENFADGWDVIAYMVGAESQASPIIGSDGAPLKGAGEITEVHLEGSELVVSDSTGATTRIAL